MRLIFLLTVILVGMSLQSPANSCRPLSPADTFVVKKCNDFSLTGNGNDPEWNKAAWNPLIKLDSGGENYKSRFKILYSPTGIYLLFNGLDKKITTEYERDFENLFRGDVFEAFFHTNPQIPMYLEYEINALNKELVLLVPNFNKKSYGWIPWHYSGQRLIKKMVSITGGKPEKNSPITEWSAELFFPYQIFQPLDRVPPASKTTWNANFYRLDYDNGKTVKYSWAPIERSFHEFEKYRMIQFE